MKEIASDLLVQRLIDWGVDTVFGLPGDGINGIMEALRRHEDRIRFVLVHHEEAAAFMACGYAKSTGRLGVCLATSGPGGLHLLNGLYDAKLDHQPVLAITGMQEMNLLGTGYQQEVHLDRVFDDVAEYSVMALTPTQIPTLVDLAVTGMQEMNLLGTGYQQEVHLDRVFDDVAEYSVMALTPTQIPTLVDLAV